MDYVTITAIGVTFTGLGVLITYLTLRKNSDGNLKADAEKDGELKTRLDYIGKGVDDIRLDIRAQDRTLSTIAERVIRVEESTKSAHRRIDTIEENKQRS